MDSTSEDDVKVLLTEQLGKGRFGNVFRGDDLRTNQTVAVKALKAGYDESRFAKEVAILKHLWEFKAHRYGIVQFHGSYANPQRAGIMFEVLDMTLNDYLFRVKNRLCFREVIAIIRQMTIALDALKQFKVIHTDINPGNIMLVDQVRQPFMVKLIGFGSALREGRSKPEILPLQTMPYWSPEILLGLRVSQATDMWSLGCVVARLFFGYNLFPGSCDYEVLRCIVELLGKPSGWHLISGQNPRCFKLDYTYLIPRWRLKTPLEFHWDTKEVTVDSRVYRFSSLDDLKVEIQSQYMSDESDIMNTCIELIQKMLTLKAAKRIKPSEVLLHPFMTRNFFDSSSGIVSQDLCQPEAGGSRNPGWVSMQHCDLQTNNTFSSRKDAALF
ncbi:hypothetical protein LDENG_00057940 [Lucifuga dentata]|nr:hypothetical protein LDENG_00057940 [Lucifuga dentata]